MAALRSRRGAARSRDEAEHSVAAQASESAPEKTEARAYVSTSALSLLRVSRLLEVLIYAVAIAHVLIAPYTKVEESFSLQAIHDILTFGITPGGLSKYDHIDFPGAVPRSFIGPLLLSVISYPVLLVGKIIGIVQNSAHAGLVVRLILACLYASSICRFGHFVVQGALIITTPVTGHLSDEGVGVRSQSDSPQRQHASVLLRCLFLAISIVQFQPLFWAGRTTPNGIVMPVVIHALGIIFIDDYGPWQHSSVRFGIMYLTASAVIARLELVGIVAPVALYALVSGIAGQHRRPIDRLADETAAGTLQTIFSRALVILEPGLLGACLAFMTTFFVDTYFWSGASSGLVVWPELQAIIYNVIEGKSADWGVSPRYAYLTSHLPKLVSAALLLAPIGLVAPMKKRQTSLAIDGKLLPMLFVCAVHVSTMSQLGHKEARFVAYLVPLLNAMAARGALVLWQGSFNAVAGTSRESRRIRQVCGRLVLAGVLAAMAALTAVSTIASAWNYPGGQALAALHRLRPDKMNATVHIDVLPAMTGVSLLQSVHLDARGCEQGWLPGVTCERPRSYQPTLHWTYDKTDDLLVTSSDPFIEAERAQLRAQLVATFDFLISDSPTCHGLDGLVRLRDIASGSTQDSEPLDGFYEFDGIRRRRPWPDVNSIKAALSRRLPLWERIKLLTTSALPIELTWRSSVWLCEREHITL